MKIREFILPRTVVIDGDEDPNIGIFYLMEADDKDPKGYFFVPTTHVAFRAETLRKIANLLDYTNTTVFGPR